LRFNFLSNEDNLLGHDRLVYKGRRKKKSESLWEQWFLC
jgi:hypothetical protein